MSIISKHAARTETMKKKYVLNLNYPNPRVANSGQYTAADDVLLNWTSMAAVICKKDAPVNTFQGHPIDLIKIQRCRICLAFEWVFLNGGGGMAEPKRRNSRRNGHQNMAAEYA
ncbi:hypothetical protein OUZ56_030022 [Daphnia magna]|uniref:Uncharacterized protein n=1 Tax=Daphnia magna TaxID=35525 RepID=A0ABR0B8K2_9CRUS|nr:hypothetical protein OUZ56_030022 [Daphnia magna]